MSQPDNQDPEMGSISAIPNDYLHESSQGEFRFGDSSAPLYTMYSKIAEEEDNKMIERWQKDAEGIIIFTGLFSAVLAAVVAVSVQDLKPNSQDTSAFYLEKMYQLQADPSVYLPPITSPLAKPPSFSPPRYAIWVNSLWFLSLVISLTCAMLATLLQQWARRYVRTTQVLRCSPEKRARMRAYFANGVDKFHVSWAVETLPTLVHLSLIMFFAGLLIYLFNINHTVFSIVGCWVALTSVAYVSITLMPIFWHDSPYYVPLTTSTSFLLVYAGIPYALFNLLFRIANRYDLSVAVQFRYFVLWRRYHDLIAGGIGKAAEETVSRQSQEIDSRVLEWTVDALHEDDQLEKFLEIIPGFFMSHVTGHLQKSLDRAVHKKIVDAAGQFLGRALSSNLVPESVTSRQLVTCLNAADAVGGLSLVAGVLRQTVINVDWRRVSLSVEIGHFLKHWVSSSYGENILEVRLIIALVISRVEECDSRWMALALDQLGVPEQVLNDYLTHGESMLVANFTHISHQLLRSNRLWFPLIAMQSLSRFDVHNVLPELQHDFCVLWNEAIEEFRKRRDTVPMDILRCARHIYIALHSGADAASTAFSTSTDTFDNVLWEVSSFPSCSIPNHLSMPHPHDLGTGEAARAPVITHPTDPHHDPTPVPIIPSPPTGIDIPSFPTPDQGPATPNNRDESIDESSLEDFRPSITTSDHDDLQVRSVGTDTSLDQGIPITTQDAGRRLTTSLTSDSDLRSTSVAPYIPQPTLTHLSGITSIVSGQQNADYHGTSPGLSTPPDSSISSPLLFPPPGHTPSVISRSLTATSVLLSEPNRATTSLIGPQEASDSAPHVG